MSWDVTIHEVPTFIATCHVGFKVDATRPGRCEWTGPQRPTLTEAEADRQKHIDEHARAWYVDDEESEGGEDRG